MKITFEMWCVQTAHGSSMKSHSYATSYEGKKQTWKKWKVLQQQENSYESAFLVNPGLDNERWDKTVYFKICNLTPKSGTLLKVCFALIEMESSWADLGMFISKRKKTVPSPRSSFLFSVYQLEIWLEIYIPRLDMFTVTAIYAIFRLGKQDRSVCEWMKTEL